jgi:hypothetical protein
VLGCSLLPHVAQSVLLLQVLLVLVLCCPSGLQVLVMALALLPLPLLLPLCFS